MPSCTAIKIDSWLEAFDPIARRIQKALGDVVEEVLGGPGRPKDLCDQFNLGGTMANRVHRAMEPNSAIDVALLLPARPTMMKIGRAHV